MTWSLSRFRAGDLVEVRSKEEILATLDQHGCVDGMPFMPEMLQFCGRRVRVSAVAHKTCDTARKTWKNRRLQAVVHLSGLLCSGAAHGGCQAECNLFWKDVWLKPAPQGAHGHNGCPALKVSHGSTEAQLVAKTTLPATNGEEPRYSCQATMLFQASEALAWWDPRQYVFDVMSGNRTLGHVLRVLWLAWLRWLLPHVPFGYRFVRWLRDWMYQSMAGRTCPALHGKVERGTPTPIGRLDLTPGEQVRIKSQEEIERTLDALGKNRGMGFDPEEMAPYCGRVFNVRRHVSRIVDEATGKMLQMKQPCVMLDGVVCSGDYAGGRLNCPRGVPAYWREIWLERVEAAKVE